VSAVSATASPSASPSLSPCSPRILAAAVRVVVATLSGGWPLTAADLDEARGPLLLDLASAARTSAGTGPTPSAARQISEQPCIDPRKSVSNIL
jgi:hypothetical protein